MNRYEAIKKLSLDEMAELLTTLRLEITIPIWQKIGFTNEQINNLKIGSTAIMKHFLESEQEDEKNPNTI